MRKLYRSRIDRKVFGVCSGMARYFEVDPTWVRFLAVTLWVFTGLIPLFLVYLVATLLIPLEPKGVVWSEYQRLTRSREDRKIAGVCGGIAEFLGVDSTLVRLFTVFLCFITAVLPLFLIYLLAWWLIPEKKGTALEENAWTNNRGRSHK